MTAEVRELLARWHAGDRDALEQLVRGHLTWIRDLVHSRMGDVLRRDVETQDMVQEAMIDVLTYGPQLDVQDASGFRSLLAQIVENNLRDQHDWRRRARRDRRRESAAVDSALAASMTTPSQAADRSEHTDWLRVALASLDRDDQEVLRLREWDKLSFQQIGERLGLRENAARMRFVRAMGRLAAAVARLQRDPPAPAG